MPNWCANTLKITCKIKDKKELSCLKEFVKGKNIHMVKGMERQFDFNKIIPYPKQYIDRDDASERMRILINKIEKKKATIKETKEAIMLKLKYDFRDNYYQDGYNSGGYQWCCNNWGTKWNAGEVTLTEKEKVLIYYFDTAWAPPLIVILKLSEFFPDLSFGLKAQYEGGEKNDNFSIKNGAIK